MGEEWITTKAELVAAIEQAWADLSRALDRLTEAQMTEATDANGWTVRDHLTHMTAWERSVLNMLQGKARHEALGVDEELYESHDFDAINARIHGQTQGIPLSTARAELRGAHEQLLEVLEPLKDADIRRPYRSYLPDETGEGEGPPALDLIYGNSAGHYREHLEWIQALVGEAEDRV